MKKRNFLKIAGGGVILAAGSTAGFLATRRPSAALAPWESAHFNYENAIVSGLSHAILAPNPHNRQPWIVDLNTSGEVRLMVDVERLLPHTDPFSRQITIGLGCFVELFDLAMREQGYETKIKLFPMGEDIYERPDKPVLIATVEKNSIRQPDALFKFFKDRRSNKDPYDIAKPVSHDTIENLSNAIVNGSTFGGASSDSSIRMLRKITYEAMEIEIQTPRTYKESVDLFRIGKSEVEENPDGIDFSGPLFETLSTFGMFTRELALDRQSSAFLQGRATVLESIETAMGHIWLITSNNTRAEQINAGRDWMRLNLATTAAGLATQPLSQALQEYAEMADVYRRIHQELAPAGGTVQMLARVGYGKTIEPSPRWPLQNKLVKTTT